MWWAAELVYGPYGPERPVRRVLATTDPEQFPTASTWYVETNLPAPDSKMATQAPLAAASLAEIVRLYGLRGWVEQSYKQLKNKLGWADAMVRADVAPRRHWLLIFCALTFCWCHWLNGVQVVRKPDQDDASQEATGEKRHPQCWVPWLLTLHQVREWLTPWTVLQRWWQTCNMAKSVFTCRRFPPSQTSSLPETARTYARGWNSNHRPSCWSLHLVVPAPPS